MSIDAKISEVSMADEAKLRDGLRQAFEQLYGRLVAKRLVNLHVRFHAALLMHLQATRGRPLPHNNDVNLNVETLSPASICEDDYPHAPLPASVEVCLQELLAFVQSYKHPVKFVTAFGTMGHFGFSREVVREAILLGHTSGLIAICRTHSVKSVDKFQIVPKEDAAGRNELSAEQAKEALWAW